MGTLGVHRLPLDRDGLWAAHEADLRLAGRATATIRSRRSILAKLTTDAGVDLSDVYDVHVRAFISRSGLGPSAVHTYLAHLRTFYAWCVDNDRLEVDPTARVPRNKVHAGLPKPISHADLSRALLAAKPRVRLWLMLGAYAGMRCAEIARLHRHDLRGGNIVVRGKGDKVRAVPLHPELGAALASWPGDGYLFPGSVDGHTSPAYVSGVVNGHLKDLGIASTAHKTRHRFGTDIYNAEHDILATSKLLGHSSVVTTQVYAQVDEPSLARMVGRLSYG